MRRQHLLPLACLAAAALPLVSSFFLRQPLPLPQRSPSNSYSSRHSHGTLPLPQRSPSSSYSSRHSHSTSPARTRSRLHATTSTPLRPQDTLEEEHDVVVIGSGIGGLCCASLCAATYGLDVAVVESHYHCGGAAHAFEIDGFNFDSGPSLFSGLSAEASPNPLLHVFQAIDEKVDWLTYNTWGVSLAQYGTFAATIGPEPFQEILKKHGGPDAQEQWERFMNLINPLSEAAMALPPSVLRNDLGVLLTMARFWRAVVKTIPKGPQLQQPFSTILAKANVTDQFILDWLSLLCFLLQVSALRFLFLFSLPLSP